MRTTIALAAAIALGGCAEDKIYVPTEHAAAELQGSGLPAADYAVPPADPQGGVKVATLGVKKRDGAQLAAVRFVITNNASDGTFRFDPAAQRLIDEHGAEVAPLAAFADGAAQGLLEVPAGAQRSIDLEFRLGHDPSDFQIAWVLDAAGVRVADRTAFRRTQLEPAYASGAPMIDGYFYAPIWNGPPFYSFYGFPPVTVRPAVRHPKVQGRRIYPSPNRRPIQVPPVYEHLPSQ